MNKRILVSAVALLAVPGLGLVQGISPAAAASPAGGARTTVTDAATSCASIAGLHVNASTIGLPTRGADVESATLTAADPKTGYPEFCLVRGKVNSFDTAAPDINFQLNLPTSWNRKSVQFGGGGFNGIVISGLGVIPGYVNSSAAQGQPPIKRGYVTFGSDGGVAVGADPTGSFALNKEALANYAGESVKRTRDAAMSVVTSYYGRQPEKQYYAGGSKGGHEALVAAQRYGDDYDGIIAYYPANQNQALALSWHHMWQQAYSRPGGYLNTAKQQLVHDAVMRACDKLDGAADGVVSDVKGCDRAFSVESLRCPDGSDSGNDCLSQRQIETLKSAASPYRFAFPLANGVTRIGPYPVLRGADLGGAWLDSAGKETASGYYAFIDPVIRYFIEQDAGGSLNNFDYRRYEARVRALSRLYDATDPDLDRFARQGGKLIIVQGTEDMLVPQSATDAYYDRLAERYGPSVRRFVRYYVQPGYGHATGRFDLAWDSLTALDKWADGQTPPVRPVATDANPATEGRTRPLCEYPLWPRYKGHGDVDQAKNFTCAGRGQH
ncbi:tannase/feruloyl esterase family alpha/beta hydrolase [Streptomyces ferrugineus]|uniref:Tannase/feruloyl esterase family alpha/beta hydrolase n=1 Tax=Streptomyces ferrugineus TaxID=1413221 RepID=A0A7M2SDE2_9ACTN|nr:tannase/feruloyl esterase family alpha/beta hydrolase [Streptomyces ferrugineus]QOV33191.1 tannase/feruloyl esterase family alpha/beta hydrolase [Streptomyces ferrugineus]